MVFALDQKKLFWETVVKQRELNADLITGRSSFPAEGVP